MGRRMSEFGSLARLDHLPPVVEQRGGDPTLVRDELLSMISDAITNHPRSQQTKIGPSEMGTPCKRRLGYKLLGVEPSNNGGGPAWRPTVGTAVHAWLEDMIAGVNIDLEKRGHPPRFYAEFKVDVGTVLGEPVNGSCDLYDRATAGVIDWKIVGPTTLKKVRSVGVSQDYKVQRQLYGRGWRRRGLAVDWVACFFLPANGELREAVWDWEPYDEKVAEYYLDRTAQVKALVTAFGRKALPILTTGDAYCGHCPFFMPASTVIEEACPGWDARKAASDLTRNGGVV